MPLSVALDRFRDMNLCLGTVQFGMDYGVQGNKRPLLSESLRMLDYAAANGIDTFDTAAGYAIAEEIIGVWIEKNPGLRNRVKIISKAAPCDLRQSLVRMGLDFLDGYLLHNPKDIFDDTIVDELVRLKKDGLAKKIGVSVYEHNEALHAISKVGLIQLPYNILDRRMQCVFTAAEKSDCTIHARSAFLQGLLLMKPENLPSFLLAARPILRDIDALCAAAGLSRKQLAIGYVKQTAGISHLVFGVDNLEQLKEFIHIFNQDCDSAVINEVAKKFENIDEDIIMPNRWRKT